MAVLKVYGNVMSTKTMRVIVCLHEKGLDYEIVPPPVNMAIGDDETDPFLSFSPFGQVPALEDGDTKLFESRAITQYLAHEYAWKGTNLIFPDAKKMAMAVAWMEVETCLFDPVASKLLWELVYNPLLGMTTDQGLVEKLKGMLEQVLDVYDKRLAESRYLGGDSFSLADLHHVPKVDYLMRTPVKEVFYARQHVEARSRDILARPSWKLFLRLFFA